MTVETDLMKTKEYIVVLILSVGCSLNGLCEKPPQTGGTEKGDDRDSVPGKDWRIESQSDWQAEVADKTDLEIADGLVTPTAEKATLRSVMKTFDKETSAQSLVIAQSPVWENWEATRISQPNMTNAPIAISCGPNDYWIFGNLRTFENMKKLEERQRAAFEKKNPEATFEPEYQLDGFVPQPATLDGYDVPLETTPYPNQYALARLEMDQIERTRGYHGWHSRDMVNWVYYGMVSQATLSTTAEYVDGKLYMYYDQPNDRDPHLFIDDDIRDGEPGEKIGLVFDAPWGGSDIAVIRDLEGKFHMISENWGPIDASKHSWDSPLASHVVSDDGIHDFQFVGHAVDERTEPTGKMATFEHPHWPAGEKIVEYEIHEPEQDAFGDWAAIAIGGQYYLFGDFDHAGVHGREGMSVGWFTSSDINEPFTFCGSVGNGHPDPDILFAEGQFYLATQADSDFVSPGPWVESVEARVGVDTDKDGSIDQWTDWQEVKERYNYTPGFAKQIGRTPAELDLSGLPAGYGFQFELRLTDTTENASKPILDSVKLEFE